ncbi:MAG TPA: penicillin-binding protein activator [Rhodanobacteraceae bacterium]
MFRAKLSAHFVLLAIAMLLMAGCATLGPSPQPIGPPQASAESARTTVQNANATLQHGDAHAALNQLATLPSSLPPELQAQALDVQARAQLALGDRVAAARALSMRTPLLPPDDQAVNTQRAVAILSGMGKDALNALYPSLPDGDPVKPYVRQALANAGVALPQTLPQLNAPVGTLTGAAMPQGFAMPPRVALLVPATGPVALAGAAVRDGFFAAYFHAPISQEQRPAIRVYDTGGTPDGAIAAYQKAASDGAALVVGPLGRAAVGAVLSQPSLPVPVLALNRAQGNQPLPDDSAEFALTPEAEGAQLAAHMITLGLHAAIVFRASDDTANRTFDAFKTQFASLGGQIANDVVLPSNAVDFTGQVQSAIAGAGDATGVVALLRPVQARLLLPQLRLARSTLPVFSTSMIYSGDENATADGDLDGVQFCDESWLYNAQAGLPNHGTLAAQLSTADGPAARLFAFGMDAYALMPYLDWLRTHPGSYLAGATGQLTMNAAGRVQRTPIWLQFQGGIAQPVAAGLEPSPAADATPTGP